MAQRAQDQTNVEAHEPEASSCIAEPDKAKQCQQGETQTHDIIETGKPVNTAEMCDIDQEEQSRQHAYFQIVTDHDTTAHQ